MAALQAICIALGLELVQVVRYLEPKNSGASSVGS